MIISKIFKCRVSKNFQLLSRQQRALGSSPWSKLFGGDPNFYELLGVEKNATQSEIRKAFIEKSKTVHPDRNQTSTAQEQFKKLNEAYSTLREPSLRREYDSILEEGETKNRYFKEDSLVYDRVTGRMYRDDGRPEFRTGYAPKFRLDPKEARKRNIRVITGLIVFGFLSAFANMAYLTVGRRERDDTILTGKIVDEESKDDQVTILKV
ncbi:dnaJ homolog subfamily C member 10-like [Symsagittifera roscoffensis]|uniref:dnaJ homolog subfamily C member 10-like n=1 Tax=Symsagittifera roscoffensis TaxID=84072 RepID=UPI00307C7BE7